MLPPPILNCFATSLFQSPESLFQSTAQNFFSLEGISLYLAFPPSSLNNFFSSGPVTGVWRNFFSVRGGGASLSWLRAFPSSLATSSSSSSSTSASKSTPSSISSDASSTPCLSLP